MAERAIEVQEKPILFSGAMVRAVIEGRKTQTRRVLGLKLPDYSPGPLVHAPKHDAPYFDAYDHGPLWCWWSRDDRQGAGWVKCPYGNPGDRLWVRETWCIGGNPTRVCYRASEGSDADYWKPSIHMPRAYSRLTLEIVSVKVERVQEISEEDAIAEGCERNVYTTEDVANLQISDANPAIKELGRILGPGCVPAKANFQRLWDSINAKRTIKTSDGEMEVPFASWKANPWVWAIEFRRLDT